MDEVEEVPEKMPTEDVESRLGTTGSSNLGALLLVMKQVLRGVRPGKSVRYDTAVPSKMLIPRSSLEVMEDMYYAGATRNSLSSIGMQATPEGRMLALVRWYLHTVTAPPYLRKPYNPILGETHVFKAYDSYMMEEQVSHHPPVTAFYGEDLSGHVKYWGQYEPHATFTGVGILIKLTGKSAIEVKGKELYEMPQVGLHLRLLPPLGAEWVGTVKIMCRSTGLCTHLEFKPRGIRPGGSWNIVSGCISRIDPNEGFKNAKEGKVLLRFKGSWMEKVVVTYKNHVGYPSCGEDIINGDYKRDVDAAFGPDFTQTLNKGDEKSSYAVWRGLTTALYQGENEMAGKEKHKVEQHERDLRKLRKENGTVWIPRFFEPSEGHTTSGERIKLWSLRTHEFSEYLKTVGGGTWPFHCPCCELFKFRPSAGSSGLQSHPLLDLQDEDEDDSPTSKVSKGPLRLLKSLGRRSDRRTSMEMPKSCSVASDPSQGFESEGSKRRRKRWLFGKR